MTDWMQAYAEPGEWVGVSVETPAWVGLLRVLPPRDDLPERLILTVSEMGVGEASAWRDGWAAFGTRARALAEALGGKAELQSFVRFRGDEERYELRYIGKATDI